MNSILVRVIDPSFEEAKEFHWPPRTTVLVAAMIAAEAFHGESTDNPTLIRDGLMFERDKTLEEIGIEDGDTLELILVGGSV